MRFRRPGRHPWLFPVDGRSRRRPGVLGLLPAAGGRGLHPSPVRERGPRRRRANRRSQRPPRHPGSARDRRQLAGSHFPQSRLRFGLDWGQVGSVADAGGSDPQRRAPAASRCPPRGLARPGSVLMTDIASRALTDSAKTWRSPRSPRRGPAGPGGGREAGTSASGPAARRIWSCSSCSRWICSWLCPPHSAVSKTAADRP